MFKNIKYYAVLTVLILSLFSNVHLIFAIENDEGTIAPILTSADQNDKESEDKDVNAVDLNQDEAEVDNNNDKNEGEDTDVGKNEVTNVDKLVNEVNLSNAVSLVNDNLNNLSSDNPNNLLLKVNKRLENQLKNMDIDSSRKLITTFNNKINSKIIQIKRQIRKNPARAMKLKANINSLNRMKSLLKASAVKTKRTISIKDRIKKRKSNLYNLRWGNLNKAHTFCDVSKEVLEEALKNSVIPEKCQKKAIEYKGKISVNTGSLSVKKSILFEKNDKVLVANGPSIEFTSTIGGHFDALLIEYIPEENPSKNLEISISIGDLNKTFNISDLTTMQDIGDGNKIEFKKITNALSTIPKDQREKLLQNKVNLDSKNADIKEKLRTIALLKTNSADVSNLETTLDEIENYNLDNVSSQEMQEELLDLKNSFSKLPNDSLLKNKTKELREKFKNIKKKAIQRKFNNKLIPFKDTDDDQWFTKYVANVKSKGIINGYKDNKGNELGEFRPSNNITVAEMLKISLETANQGKAIGKMANIISARKHWANEYVARAEELGLDIVDTNILDLNRFATRAEVVRMMLESLGIQPDKIDSSDFADVSKKYRFAPYIQEAKNLGIVSGDAGSSNFRPEDPINRAEAAKIANKILELFSEE